MQMFDLALRTLKSTLISLLSVPFQKGKKLTLVRHALLYVLHLLKVRTNFHITSSLHDLNFNLKVTTESVLW